MLVIWWLLNALLFCMLLLFVCFLFCLFCFVLFCFDCFSSAVRSLLWGKIIDSWCYHFVFEGVTHDYSVTQNRTPFLRFCKYTLRNFNPYFAQKQVQFSLKKNPFFLHFKCTFANMPLFQPSQEQTDHFFTSIFHRSQNLHPNFEYIHPGNQPFF